jgi:uncharacterized protein YecT (DUF1311 family)
MLFNPEADVRMLFSLCVLLLAQPGLAASFNCAKARTPQEKAICASPNLSAADDQMAAAYKALVHALPPSFQDEIRADQRVWIRRLAIVCPANNPEQHQYLETCILARENARTDSLKHMFYKQAGITFAWHSVFRETPGDPNAGDETEGPGSLEASWPEALSAAPEWRAWNTAIETAIHKIARQSNVDTPELPPAEWQAVEGSDVNVSVSIDFVGTGLVTSTITNFWDGHGAHPNTDTMQFNWMLKEQRRVRPEDIFRARSDWNSKLYTLCNAYLHKTLDTDPGEDYTHFSAPGTIAERVHAVASDPESWQIDERGITMVFQPYAVACYACTPPPFTVPWIELQPLLNPDFKIPHKQ